MFKGFSLLAIGVNLIQPALTVHWLIASRLPGNMGIYAERYSETLGISEGARFVAAGSNREHTVWAEGRPPARVKYDNHRSEVERFTFSQDHKHLMTHGTFISNGSLWSLEGESLGYIGTYYSPSDQAFVYRGEPFTYEPETRAITLQSQNQTIMLTFKGLHHPSREADLSSMKFALTQSMPDWETLCQRVYKSSMDARGRFVAINCFAEFGKKDHIRLYDAQTGQLLHELSPPHSGCDSTRSMQLSPDGKELGVVHYRSEINWFSAFVNPCVYRWDLTQNPPKAHQWLGREIGTIAYSPDNQYVGVAGLLGVWIKKR